MFLSVSEFGLLLIVVFGVMHWLGIFSTLRAVLAFFGAVIVFGAGFIGSAITAIASWLQHATGSATAWAFGAAVPAALFVVLAIVLVHDVHPKNSAGKRTGLIALLAGACVAAGVAGIPALAGLHGLVVHLAGQAVSVINAAGGR